MAKLTIISPRSHPTNVWHELVFDSKETPGCSYAFRCSADGVLENPTHLPRIAELNADPNYEAPRVQEYKSSYVQPAIGLCSCGEHVELRNALDNECDKCGAHYNMVGQLVYGLNDPIMEDIRADELTLSGR